MSVSALLLLTDGRFPAGGHAHSAGLEPAVAAGLVRDLTDVQRFLGGRLATVGLVSAAFAVHACLPTVDLDELEAALDARTPSAALRTASRRQGRATVRAARAIWPAPALAAAAVRPGGVHHAVALGLAARVAGLGPAEAATLAAYGCVAGPASAAVRLLSLDPFAVHAVLARLGPDCDRIAASAAGYASRPVAELPAGAAPMLDIVAESHARWEVRLFAS
jgi:urease accessory protein